MIKYPKVIGESETLDLVLSGRSLARYGDGEFKLCWGGLAIKSQIGSAVLRRRLAGILKDPGACLVGIPNITTASPKYETTWHKYERASELLSSKLQYCSSFITRPDSAPWIDTDDYWTRLESLWKDQEVTLVRGSSKSLVAEDLTSARMVTEIVCKRQHAFDEYESILYRIGKADRVLLCLGPTATVLAADLCAKGIHAVDLGHIGLFLRKHRKGLPMWVTKDDKASATC